MEYRLFTEYYSKLVNTLPASDLSHYFVSDKIISLEDHERVIRSIVPQDAAKLLLDKVSLQIQNGSTSVFSKMLLIMDYHGVNTAKTISLEIRKKLLAIKCEKGNSEYALHICTYVHTCTNCTYRSRCMSNYVATVVMLYQIGLKYVLVKCITVGATVQFNYNFTHA